MELLFIRHQPPCGGGCCKNSGGITVAARYDNDEISIGIVLHNALDNYSRKRGRTVAIERARNNPYMKYSATERYGEAVSRCNDRLKNLILEKKAEGMLEDVHRHRKIYVKHLSRLYAAEEREKMAKKEEELAKLRPVTKIAKHHTQHDGV